MRQLKDGVLSLTAEIFDPNELLEEIVDTFIPQAKAQRVSLRFQPKTELRMPEEMYPHIKYNSELHNQVERGRNALLIDSIPELVLPCMTPLPKLRGDGRRFRQVVINLVKNALKFSKIDGKILIEAGYTVNGFLAVNVLDDGAGIAKEDFPKLFTRFGKL